MSVRKISDDPFFLMPLCPSPEHLTPPAQACRAAKASTTPVEDFEIGQYEHVCPDCGNVTRFGVYETTYKVKEYREFSGSILSGVRYNSDSSAQQIEQLKLDAAAFLREQKRLREGRMDPQQEIEALREFLATEMKVGPSLAERRLTLLKSVLQSCRNFAHDQKKVMEYIDGGLADAEALKDES